MKKMTNNRISVEWEVTPKAELEQFMEKSVNATLRYENVDFPCAVEVLVVDGDTIREMNNEYRGVDRVTDVLSFPLYENAEQAAMDIIPDEETVLGNMVICIDRAIEQAEEFGHSLEREICFLTVHSTLHLLGYDHELGEYEENEMFAKQRKILNDMGVHR